MNLIGQANDGNILSKDHSGYTAKNWNGVGVDEE